jgi:hypothetical protein
MTWATARAAFIDAITTPPFDQVRSEWKLIGVALESDFKHKSRNREIFAPDGYVNKDGRLETLTLDTPPDAFGNPTQTATFSWASDTPFLAKSTVNGIYVAYAEDAGALEGRCLYSTLLCRLTHDRSQLLCRGTGTEKAHTPECQDFFRGRMSRWGDGVEGDYGYYSAFEGWPISYSLYIRK